MVGKKGFPKCIRKWYNFSMETYVDFSGKRDKELYEFAKESIKWEKIYLLDLICEKFSSINALP